MQFQGFPECSFYRESYQSDFSVPSSVPGGPVRLCNELLTGIARWPLNTI